MFFRKPFPFCPPKVKFSRNGCYRPKVIFIEFDQFSHCTLALFKVHGKKTRWYYTKSNEDCLVMLSEAAFHLCMEVVKKRYCNIR